MLSPAILAVVAVSGVCAFPDVCKTPAVLYNGHAGINVPDVTVIPNVIQPRPVG